MNSKIVGKSEALHPQKFAMYLAIAGMMMMFAALTSAYLVRKAAGNWLEFPLPNVFYISTFVLILSSVSLQFAHKSYIQEHENAFKGWLIGAFILGGLFLVLQYEGWLQMNKMNIFVNTNPSSSFIFLISGLHALHIVAGVSALAITLFLAFARKFQVTPKRKLKLELVIIFWHFIDFLWLYLFIFLLTQ